MIGFFFTRILVMIFGYMYPAYECFKSVERNKPEIEQLRFWCQYWILAAVLTVFERVADTFVSWVPMYCEAKLVFIIYLWYPKTKGTNFVYESFFKPFLSKHETVIDRNLLELRTRAGDLAFMYCQKAVGYGQTRIFEILHFVASQSTPKPRSTKTRKPQPQDEEPISPTTSTSSSQREDEMEDEQTSVMSAVPSSLKKAASVPFAPNSPRRPATPKADKPRTAKSLSPEDVVMEDTIQATRGRLRKTNSTVNK
ncbi:putative HVA22-like protein g [Silene latifolia]|uniref:putative HVA22-like protein g n=1 Tax=Silene latifolia TaxID=37657 RepID=UPI003D771548